MHTRGLAHWFVDTIQTGLCPACKAYENEYGGHAQEPMGGVQGDHRLRPNPFEPGLSPALASCAESI
jgi:hypothetical protein